MILRCSIALALGLVLTGCGIPQRLGFNRSEPETPLPFAAKLNKGESDRLFTVTVDAKGAGIDAVRESARHPATGFCLMNFGGSAVEWATDNTGEWQATRGENGSVTFAGRCSHR